MSGLVFLRILLLAGEALAASCALPALAWAASLAFRKRANMRHLIRTAAFAGLLVLPPLALLLPAQLIFHHSVAAERVHTVILEAPIPGTVLAPDHDLTLSGGTILTSLLAAWALGVLIVAGQSLIAARALRELRRRSVLHDLPSEDLPKAGRAWELRLSGLCAGPMTWGVLKPVVLLPWDAIHWPRERMRTVLAHELAHVRRRDSLAQAIATAACALYWPSPLVWLAAKALRRDAEIASDDAVIASGVRPSDYAEALVGMAKAMRGQRLAAAPALAMANPSALAERVSSILSPTPVRTGVTVMDAFKIIGAGCVATAALALARPGIAETAAATQPAPAPVAVQELLATPAPAAAAPATSAKPTPKPAVKHTVIVTSPDGQAKVAVDSAQISADVRKAIADAHISETVAKEVAAGQLQAQAEVAKQMVDLQPRIQKAIADAHIDERIAQHLADLQPRIDAAVAKANAAAAKAEKAREDAEKARKGIGELRIGVDPIG